MFVIVFTDDILVYLRRKNEHIDPLRIILKILKVQQLFVKYRKCQFWLRSMDFLGQIVSNRLIEVDSVKTYAINSWFRPL